MKEMLLAMLGPVAASAYAGEKNERSKYRGDHMEHLFGATLKHTDKADISPNSPIEGALTGGGEGTVRGQLNGRIRCSLYENSTRQSCTMQIPGQILTEDSATISFQGQEHAIVPDSKLPSPWKVGGAFRSQTEDKRYVWLNSILALWVGDFNMDSVEAHHRFYVHCCRWE
ncbi:MAG: hypothetical protein AB1898_08470 [Acidobacteriota bacterium]